MHYVLTLYLFNLCYFICHAMGLDRFVATNVNVNPYCFCCKHKHVDVFSIDSNVHTVHKSVILFILITMAILFNLSASASIHCTILISPSVIYDLWLIQRLKKVIWITIRHLSKIVMFDNDWSIVIFTCHKPTWTAKLHIRSK